jgi:hypothetical protein
VEEASAVSRKQSDGPVIGVAAVEPHCRTVANDQPIASCLIREPNRRRSAVLML